MLPLAVAALLGAIPLVLLRVRDGWLAYAGVLAAVMVTIGFVVYPRIDAVRSVAGADGARGAGEPRRSPSSGC